MEKLELLFKQKPEEAYVNSDDLNNYKEILIATSAHKKKYSSYGLIRVDKSFKYTNIIAKHFSNKETGKRRPTNGESLKSNSTKFKVGNKVQVSKIKNVFEKGYISNWSTKIFSISQVMSTKPVTYKLKDYQDQPIAGGFYQQELFKVKYLYIYLIEKILKKREDKIYVKWLGFDSSHNSWIEKSDM